MTLTISAQAKPLGDRLFTAGDGGRFEAIQAAIDAVPDDVSPTNRFTVLILPGTHLVSSAVNGGIELRGSNWAIDGSKDGIDLIGADRGSVNISRPTSPGSGDPVIQCSSSNRIADLTITTPVSRAIHWDSSAGSVLEVDSVTCVGGGCPSAGGIGGSRMILNNCIIDGGGLSCHGGSGAGLGTPLEIVIRNCWITAGTSGLIGFDLEDAGHDTIIHITGTTMKYYNPDPGYVSIVMPDLATSKVFVFTDLSAGMFRFGADPNMKGWNSVQPPQAAPYMSSTVTQEGDCVVYDFATDRVKRIAAADTAFPGVVAEQLDDTGTSGWSPRLVTGAYAAVKILTAQAVAVGDIIVTSATAGLATVNNAQTDLTKILGWAITTKAGAVAGRVNVRLNQLVKW